MVLEFGVCLHPVLAVISGRCATGTGGTKDKYIPGLDHGAGTIFNDPDRRTASSPTADAAVASLASVASPTAAAGIILSIGPGSAGGSIPAVPSGTTHGTAAAPSAVPGG